MVTLSIGGLSRTRRVAALLLPLLLACGAQAASLQLQWGHGDAPSGTSPEYGKPLFARLIYQGSERAAKQAFDLEDWSQDVVIQREDVEVDAGRRELSMRIYARAAGSISLSAIAHGGALLRPVPLHFKRAERLGKLGGAQRLPPPQALKDGVYVGQAFVLRLAIDRLHPANEFRALEREWEGFEVRALPQQERVIDGRSQRLLAWSVVALRPGLQRFELPAVERRGHGRFRFYFPPVTLRVWPLPDYLPPATPVGTIHSHSVRRNDEWHIELQSTAWLAHGLPALESALQGDLDEASAALAGSGKAFKLARSIDAQPSADGLLWRLRYRLPIPPATSPFPQRLEPSAKLWIFDPQQGAARPIELRLPAVWQIQPWHWLALLGLIVVLIALPGSRPMRRHFAKAVGGLIWWSGWLLCWLGAQLAPKSDRLWRLLQSLAKTQETSPKRVRALGQTERQLACHRYAPNRRS